MTKQIEAFIQEINFPIESPDNLEVLLNGKSVDSYDPVYDIRIEGDKLVITGYLWDEYEHIIGKEIDELVHNVGEITMVKDSSSKDYE